MRPEISVRVGACCARRFAPANAARASTPVARAARRSRMPEIAHASGISSEM